MDIYEKLDKLVKANWPEQENVEKIWLRAYSFISPLDQEKLKEFAEGLVLREFTKKIAVGFSISEKFPVANIYSKIISTEKSPTEVFFKFNQYELPRTPLFLLFFPIEHEGFHERDTIKAFDIFGALFGIHFGTNTTVNVVFDGPVNLKKKTFSFLSPVSKIPKSAEGPVYDQKLKKLFNEHIKSLENLHKEQFEKVELSLEYFHRAQHEVSFHNYFFSYWTSLEILCGGTSNKIQSDLIACSSIKGAVQKLGFNKIKEWRRKLIHDGKRPSFPGEHYIRRYFDFLYLDLMRHSLGLASLNLAFKQTQKSAGLDLRPLGLGDNRSPEAQKTEDYSDNSTVSLF